MFTGHRRTVGEPTPPSCKRNDDGKVIESCGWCGCKSSGVEHSYTFNVCGACGNIRPR